MNFVRIDYSDTFSCGKDFTDYLALRRRVFVDQLRWPLWNDGKIEIDQYDNPCASYVIVKHFGAVVGGARLLPATSSWGGWTHMLADTASGRIETMNSRIVDPQVDLSACWECSRLIIDDTLLSPAERHSALYGITESLVQMAVEGGAEELASISPPSLRRTLQRMGYKVSQIGPIFQDRYDGRNYCALKMARMATAVLAA